MALNKFHICDEVKDSLEKFNKLLEQSELYANQFYEQIEKFNSKKQNESDEITSETQRETTELIEENESDFHIGRDLIKESESEITAGNTKMKSRSLRTIESIKEMELRLEFERSKSFTKTESDSAFTGELKPTKLIGFFESKKYEDQKTGMIKSANEYNYAKNTKTEIEKRKSFIKSESELAPTGDMQISNLDKGFESKNSVSQDTGMIKSTKENKSESQEPIMVKSRKETNSILKEYKEKNKKLKEKSKHLESKLSRDNCQIFIYGQVSAGKSKIINAILGEEIFQSTVAHTTSCFVKICKSSDLHHHIEYGNNKETFDQLDNLKNKIKELSTEFTTNKYKLKTNELLSVYLNIPNNKILTSNTEIIDCPGSANKNSITKNLKNKALDAHIFIFVLNNGITDEDKVFFQNQLEQSSSPTIFILVNKWDLAYIDGVDCAETSKIAITKDLKSFLKNNLHLSENEANHIYFVSAEDMYIKRNIKKTNFEKTYGYDERCFKFEEFEDTLSQFINTLNENKLNHYKEELHITRKTINEYLEKFKIEFLRICDLKDIHVEWPNYRCELQKSFNEQICYINNVHDKLNNKINVFFDKYVNNLKRDKIEILESNFNALIKDGKNHFLKSEKKVSAYIDEENKKYKTLTSIEKEKGELRLNEMMKMDIKLKKIHDTAWERFCRKFTDIFKILKNHYENNLKIKDSSTLNDNKDEIKLNVTVFKNYASEYFDSLSGYMQVEINGIIDELDYKIKIYNEYLANIENLFQLKEKC